MIASGNVIEPFLPLKPNDPVFDALVDVLVPAPPLLPPKPHSNLGVEGKNDDDRLERVRGVPGRLADTGELAPFEPIIEPLRPRLDGDEGDDGVWSPSSCPGPSVLDLDLNESRDPITLNPEGVLDLDGSELFFSDPLTLLFNHGTAPCPCKLDGTPAKSNASGGPIMCGA